MPTFNARSFYDPAVKPDTGEGLARGIESAGQSIAGALNMYTGYKRQDARDEKLWAREDARWDVENEREDMEFQRRMARDDMMFNREDQRYQQRLGDEKAQKALMKEEKSANIGGAVAALGASGFLSADQLALYDHADPKLKDGIGEALMSYGGYNARQRAEMNAQQQADEWRRQNPPQAWAVPVPGQEGRTIYGVGNNPMGQTQPQAPQLSPEDLAAYGLQVQGVTTGPDGTVMRYGPPPASRPVRGVYVKQPDGTMKLMDPTIPPAAGAGAGTGSAPAGTPQNYFRPR